MFHTPLSLFPEYFPEGAGTSSLEADDVQPLRHVGQAGKSFAGAPDSRHRTAHLREFASIKFRKERHKHSLDHGPDHVHAV